MNAPLNSQPPGLAKQFTALTADELENLPDSKWLVQGVLPSKGIVCVGGPSQVGKSALGIHLARALSVGEPWFGFDVDEKYRVTYVALEGRGSLKARSRALSLTDPPGAKHDIRFIVDPLRINDPSNVKALAAEIERIGGADVVIIDTLNCAAPEADENSSRDMGLIIAGAKQLQEAVDGLVVLVHHVGKDSSRGLRGHSSLLAALDAVLMVTRSDEWRSWTLVKSRDSEDGTSGSFKLDSVVVGEDDKGRHQTAALVVPSEPPVLPSTPVSALRDNQKAAYLALAEALGVPADQGEADGEVQPAVALSVEAAVELVKERLDGVEPKRRGERAKAAIQTLLKGSLLRLEDGRLSLPSAAVEA